MNSVNHGYDATEFLLGLPTERTLYIHIAGHTDLASGVKIDTHGAPVIDPVWDLLHQAYIHLGSVPTLLERDANFPPASELIAEVSQIRRLQQQFDE